MTSHERIALTFNHQEPDRVPYDLCGTTVTSICKNVFRRTMEERGLSIETQQMVDPVQQIITPVEETLVKLGSDTRRIGSRRITTFESLVRSDGNVDLIVDQWYCQWKFDKTKDFYFNQINFPMQDYESLTEALEHYDRPDLLADLGQMKQDWEYQSGFLGDFCGVADRNTTGLTEMSLRIRGYEKWYMDIFLDRASMERFLEMILQFKMEYWSALFNWFKGKGIKDKMLVISECDDLGTQKSTLISPDDLNELVIPRFKRLWEFNKKNMPKARNFLHSCGAKGKPKEVRDEVKKILDIMSPGGGFVFAPVHNIQDDVSAENFWAMWDTFQEYGKYR